MINETDRGNDKFKLQFEMTNGLKLFLRVKRNNNWLLVGKCEDNEADLSEVNFTEVIDKLVKEISNSISYKTAQWSRLILTHIEETTITKSIKLDNDSGKVRSEIKTIIDNVEVSQIVDFNKDSNGWVEPPETPYIDATKEAKEEFLLKVQDSLHSVPKLPESEDNYLEPVKEYKLNPAEFSFYEFAPKELRERIDNEIFKNYFYNVSTAVRREAFNKAFD
tara:strand:- start:27750 stop:28412 length:663 start_codon:yes stop_codon:yes gene_type:complete